MGRKSLPRTRIHDLEINWDYYQRHQVPDPDTGCIAWDAGRHKQGYGMVGAWRQDGTKIMTTTHRIAARIHWDRAIDSSELVIHKCSNMNCMNPEHLLIGDRYAIHQVMRANQRYRPRGLDIYSEPPNTDE
jgi:hypothetical protein